MPKLPKIGDVIEIATSKGLAFAQYTHQWPRYGGLIRVFDGLFSSRPVNLEMLARRSVQFSTFVPVRAMVNRGIVGIAGNVEIAPANRPFPLFRCGLVDKDKKVKA